MNIGFVMYNWESVKPKLDTTLRLIHESLKEVIKLPLFIPMKWQLEEQ